MNCGNLEETGRGDLEYSEELNNWFYT